MGVHDRDWFHEGREERDKIPHPGQRKPVNPQVLLSAVPKVNIQTKGSFLTGFVVGFSLATILILLVILFVKNS